MANVLLIVLLMISVVMIGLILIQRSEGGALGIGGGGGGAGGFMSGRGTVDLVSKLTAWVGGAFLLVCLLISISFNFENRDRSLLDTTNAQGELVPEQKTDKKPLNPNADSSKDVTPLGEAPTAKEETPKADNGTSEKKDEKPQ